MHVRRVFLKERATRDIFRLAVGIAGAAGWLIWGGRGGGL